MRSRTLLLATPCLGLGLGLYMGVTAPPAAAQEPLRTLASDDWCKDGDGDHDLERHCEVREATLPLPAGVLRVDSSPNGGIEVRGWARKEFRLRAKVVAQADSEGDARALAEEVQVRTSGGIHAEGPRTRGHRAWWVSYQLSVPTDSSLSLESVNGGIHLENVVGAIDFRTVNGGVHLEAVGGNVRGRTSNGGVTVRLAGTEWKGEGLDVETTNGGVTLGIPANFNGHFETGTTNGGMNVDFPVTVQGQLNQRRLAFDLGHGGRTVRAITTNGGVRLRRSRESSPAAPGPAER